MPSSVPSPVNLRDEIPCLLCQGTETSTMHRKEPYRIVRCQNCGLVYTLPRLSPEAITEMYQEDYWKSDSAKDFGYTDYLADAELYKKTFRMRSAVLRRHRPPPARVLEVGCAAGFALEVLQEQGYDVYGAEISSAMVAEAGRRIGSERIHHGPLQRGIHGDQKFDVITMWDVVEHVEDPIELLRIARSMIADDGILVLETQNVASMFARMLGVNWQHYKFEEHLYHFDPKTIQVLLARGGWSILENSSRRGGKYVSLGFVVERVGRIHPLLSKVMSPMKVLGKRSLYVNVFDEMLVVARPTDRSDG